MGWNAISTRTPEGEPLQCAVCGNENFVLLSQPPGDSVCPNCGSHAWIASKKVETHFPSAEVLQLVPALVDRIRLSRSRMEVATNVVDGLYQCLAPQGVSLWLLNPMAGKKSMQFELAAFRGETYSMDSLFANLRDGHSASLTANSTRGERLMIRLPLTARNKLRAEGVLEVIQRIGITSDAHDGWLRFVRSMAAVSSGCRAFSN